MSILSVKVRIGTANIFAGNTAPRFHVQRLIKFFMRWWLKLDSLGIQEGGNANDALSRVSGYKAFWHRAKNRDFRSNVTLVDAQRYVISTRYWPAAKGAGTRTTPPRHIFATAYTKRGKKIVHINTHFHVVDEQKLARTSESNYPLPARQYVAHLKLLKSIMLDYTNRGYIVFVTADNNTRPTLGQPDWKYAAYHALDGWGGFRVIRNGVDIIVYNVDKVSLDGVKIAPKEVVGSDTHESLAAKFSVR